MPWPGPGFDSAAGCAAGEVWLQPSIPLMFTFAEPRGPELDRAWIESLTRSANSTGGLTLVPQDGESTELAAEQPDSVSSDGR
ncbi:DUF7882 family protein [Microbacterium sp. I2]|uniref:DUF7882 family protein n=1 Tax=Microbacterium sp. I2 TaxID=3391826 RepID=UPI003F52546F